MKIAFIAMSLIAAAQLANAEGNPDHPAIAARRVIAAQGYDHASAFYRHPAGLNLSARAPQEVVDRPADVTAKATGVERRGEPQRSASRK